MGVCGTLFWGGTLFFVHKSRSPIICFGTKSTTRKKFAACVACGEAGFDSKMPSTHGLRPWGSRNIHACQTWAWQKLGYKLGHGTNFGAARGRRRSMEGRRAIKQTCPFVGLHGSTAQGPGPSLRAKKKVCVCVCVCACVCVSVRACVCV